MATQEGDTTPVVPEFQLGVLLVHGIGTQRSGDTLVRWGDVLLKTIELATKDKVIATIERAGPSDGPGKGRFEAAVQFRTDDRAERWLLSEGWWADAFPAPSYRELVSWSVRALPWSIATHIAERYWQASSRDWNWKGMFSRDFNWARIFALAIAVSQLIVALLLAPVSISLLGLSLLVGLLPVPQIRTAILAAQSTLTATVGDSLAFVESPIRAALIRTCILDGLARLKQRCKNTVIVAHSQGAAVVIDALGGFPELDKEREKVATVPDALVTFGAGTNQLASQKALSEGLPNKKFGTNPVFGAVGALFGAAGLLFWLYLSATMKDIVWALLVVLLALVPLVFVMWVFLWLIQRWQPSDRALSAVGAILGVFILVGMLPFWWYGEHAHLPLFPVFLLLPAFISIAGSMGLILSDRMKDIVTAPVRRPLDLIRWVDLYASSDPVPNGETRTNDADRPESIPIWNLGSFFADHTAYWANRDGFVLRVARVCVETAQSPWKSTLPGKWDFVDKRAAWRVGFLRMARRSTGLTWLVLGVFLWSRYQASIPVTFDLPGWVPAAPVRLVLLVTFIASAMWATSSLLRWLWNWWVRAEQEAVLAHDQPGSESYTWYRRVVIFFMAMVVWTLIFATYVLMKSNSWAELGPSLDANSLESFMVLAPAIAAWAAISTFVLLWWKRPPDASPSWNSRDAA